MWTSIALPLIGVLTQVSGSAPPRVPECRSERMHALPVDRFKSDACARCYHYMQLQDSFHFKFLYDAETGDLHHPFLNRTLRLDWRNLSQELLDSFRDARAAGRWAECCFAAAACCDAMVVDPPTVSDVPHCPRTWDGWTCFPDTPAGQRVRQDCPKHIYWTSAAPACRKNVFKECAADGTWWQNEYKREWTDYVTCRQHQELLMFENFHIGTYVVSIVALIPSLIIFSTYKQLSVPRISLHKNLFASLLLHNLFEILVKVLVVYDELNRMHYPRYVTVMDHNGPYCKILLIISKYFAMTNHLWMLCEGLYLQLLIAATFKEQKSLRMYYLIGWGSPLLPMGIYSVLRAILNNEQCWIPPVDEYEWIIIVPCMLCLLANCVFLFNIIRILCNKIRANIENEPSNYRKAVRATLVLLPLFGLHYLFVFWRPETGICGLYQGYRGLQYAFDGLQGFAVACVFCFFNGEVQYLLRRSYERYKITYEMRSRKNSASTRRWSTTLTTVHDEHRNNHHRNHEVF